MADLTHGAVDSLVGLLSTAVKDEARLLGGVHGDMQFIKDEMESMNGFLLHLTKMESEHDDQLRAWMKQVRDIAYIAEDYIQLYMRDLTPPDRGFWGLLHHLPVFLLTMPARHRLATKIRELKVRVRDVGERRQRYDVTVPHKAGPKQKLAAVQDQAAVDEERDAFLRALARDKKQEAPAPSFSHAIRLLPDDLASEAALIRDNLGSCMPDHATRTVCMEMLLRAFRAYPQGRRTTKQHDLGKLLTADSGADDLSKEVMIFCYSKLSMHYKSCLQYLTAFQKEKSISRTSLVRRWVAEGLVERQGHQTLEQAAEHCFNELLFRGFLLPCDAGTAGKVKSCQVDIDKPVWSFVIHITQSENFVSHLPIHLYNQVRIRDIVKGQEERQQKEEDSPRSICGLICPPMTKPRDDTEAGVVKDPLDEMVEFLKSLPLTYRLNVLDLGGCRGLKKSHLKSICKVLSLKYLSLRNTDAPRLPRQINMLKLLETLDIRQTHVRRPSDTEHICLPKLKHLLAGPTSEEKEPLMPCRIGTMRSMEILSRFQVPHGDAAQLEEVGRLQQLRKLGVVLGVGGSSEESKQDTIKHLLRAITKLSGCLRSLSIWISPPPAIGEGVEMNIEQDVPHGPHPVLLESLEVSGLGNAELPAAWIQKLQRLSKITLCETSLSSASLRNLGRQLPGLRCLRLRRHSYSERELAFSKVDGFKSLQFLEVKGETVASIIFEEDGAAPALEKIVWLNGMMDMTTGTLSGIHHLPRLEAVHLKGDISCDTGTVEEAIAAHPNRPTLKHDAPRAISIV